VRGGGHRDPAATAAAKFTDQRSYVRLDGKKFLFGDDIEQLRREVFERDGYRCTGVRQWPCPECGGNGCEDCEGDGYIPVRCDVPVTWETGHMHHIRRRGHGKSGLGDDSPQNCITHCELCHRKEHPRVRLRWMKETA
jgi:hypothetical protein